MRKHKSEFTFFLITIYKIAQKKSRRTKTFARLLGAFRMFCCFSNFESIFHRIMLFSPLAQQKMNPLPSLEPSKRILVY